MPEGKKKKRKKQRYNKIKMLKNVKAILNSNTLAEAYLTTHPNSTHKSAVKNGCRMISPELLQMLYKTLQLEKVAETNREMIEKILQIVIARWLNKEEHTNNMLQAINILSKLVPDFKERVGVEDLTKLSEEEVDKRLRKFGVTDVSLNN